MHTTCTHNQHMHIYTMHLHTYIHITYTPQMIHCTYIHTHDTHIQPPQTHHMNPTMHHMHTYAFHTHKYTPCTHTTHTMSWEDCMCWKMLDSHRKDDIMTVPHTCALVEQRTRSPPFFKKIDLFLFIGFGRQTECVPKL